MSRSSSQKIVTSSHAHFFLDWKWHQKYRKTTPKRWYPKGTPKTPQKVPNKSALGLRRSWWCNRLRRRWNTQWQHLSEIGMGQFSPNFGDVSPRKPTWQWKIPTIWRCISVFKMVMFHCHVSFREVITRLSNFYTLGHIIQNAGNWFFRITRVFGALVKRRATK